ncbi:hypothetical protein GCM10010289_22370 [Streptomyces violascens]|uniref:DUF4232 domain-containing protein n=1 Tax=Streptomyces violascens TaxID=67381 RepID=A0ABQ3QEF3_9ACTN|nr:hypothetical protein GCM10010289_22370 [Streptomyces violascens]GHI35635.1 hypothetical protein Sviol_00430 [Streptomyces violascens]
MTGPDRNGDRRPGDGGTHGEQGAYGSRRAYGESGVHKERGAHGEHGKSGPDQRPRNDLNDLTGYGFVDKTPEKNSTGNPPLGLPLASAGPGAADELALRRLLHDAVDDLMPSEGALDHLRAAVPVRRARKRQAVVGSVAAALLVATAVPAFIHVANTSGSADDRPAVAGHGERTHGTVDSASGNSDGVQESTPRSGIGSPAGTPDSTGRTPQPSKGTTGATAGGATGAGSGPVQANSPVCEAGELSVKSASVGKPDSTGKVYGAFRIVNASNKQCAIGGAGKFNVQAQGAANPAKITVVEHAAGDPAPGLPDPSKDTTRLVLKPAAAYEVRFAWVPSDTCPKTPPSPDPSPSNAASGSTSGIVSPTTATAAGGQTAQLGADGTPTATADGTVAVTHVAEPGAPSAEAKIPNACAGTIYKTGVLDAGTPSVAPQQ